VDRAELERRELDDIHRVLLRELVPALNREGVFIKRSFEWSEADGPSVTRNETF